MVKKINEFSEYKKPLVSSKDKIKLKCLKRTLIIGITSWLASFILYPAYLEMFVFQIIFFIVMLLTVRL